MRTRFCWLAGGLFLCVALAFLLRSHERSARTGAPPLGKKSTGKQSVTRADTSRTSANLSNSPSAEFDPAVNPYAGALREAGKSKRPWDAGFLQRLGSASSNAPIQFELTDGVMASGVIKIAQQRDAELTYISGELTQPETGKFFFLKPPEGGKAGKAVGVVEFWGSKTAYRIEPTGAGAEPELWKRRLDEVLCQTMPLMDPAAEIAQMPPLRPDLVPDYAPDYNSNIVSLQSYPGSSAVLLLDFFGGYTPTWNGVSYPRPNVNNAQIKDVWKRVAEDYIPFNINVTTDLRVYNSAPVNTRQKCVFTPTTSAMPAGAAGVAYIGSWDWGSDTVCWSIYTSGKAAAEVGSHEAGHTVGLGHQGTTTSGYYSGQGSGVTGWAPIMGAGYYDNVVSWAKGEYQNANNHEDELNIIITQNTGVTYRPDDTGSTLATSRYLETWPGNTASAEGVIERTGDTDAFQFTTGGGLVSLTASPVGDWANLAISATLANSSETIIASNNPQTSLSASIGANVLAGTYTFRVTGVGRNNPLTDGFSSYGSLGYYSITGTVMSARLPTRLSVAEHAPSGTLVGTVYPLTTNGSLSYAIVAGNTNNTFSIDNRGTVRVANNVLLDYNRLATNTMFPIQFQLFVNISDLVNPSFNETNRRVVIAVLNVNDPPIVTGFTASVFEHTQIGTPIGTVAVRDADFGETLSFSIVSGDTNGLFNIDDGGVLSVAGDLDLNVQSSYSLAVAVNDNVIGSPQVSTGYVTINLVTNRSVFHPGSINYALYDSLGSGTLVTDLTGSPRWPRDPTSELPMTSFEGLPNRADNFGAAMRGYLIPPLSGGYNFFIASDDSSELWISTSTNNATLSRIAYVSGYTGVREWTKFTSQQSAVVTLTAGQAYYIEARMKEGGGNDNLSVAWRGPATGYQTSVIPGLYLAPFAMNYVPHATGFSATLRQGAYTGTAVGRVVVTDVNAADTQAFAITSGNGAGLFSIDSSGVIRVADDVALAAAPTGTYNLNVLVTDSGLPTLSAGAAVSINLVATDAPLANVLRREIWSNIGSGTAVSDLTNNAAFPNRPDKLEVLTSFASARDIAENYGSRIRVFLTPTNTGYYRFFISSDDSSSLLMGTDTNAATAVRIAYLNGASSVNAWTANASQISGLRYLVAGQSYYLEALQKEGGGGDHVEVAWTGPGVVDAGGVVITNVIAGSFLSPVDLNCAPRMANQTMTVFDTVTNGTAVGRVLVQDSPFDSFTFKILDGNTNNTFAIDESTGTISVNDNSLIAGGAGTSFPLTVAVQDSGYGGLYPPEGAQGIVTVSVRSANGTPFVWTGAANTNAWSSPGNWGGVAPSNGARLIFGYAWQQPNFNDSLGTVSWIQFTNGGFNLSGGSLSLNSGITNRGDNAWAISTSLGAVQTWQNSSGTLSLQGNITNRGFGLNLLANGDVRVSGILSGPGGLTKTGTSRLIMQGAHTYSGATIIAAASGATTALEVGASDLLLSGSDLSLSGRMDLGNHDATIGALNGSGLIFANDLTRTLTVGINDHSGSFSGVIQNTASGSGVTLNLVKTGTGIQTLSGANTYSGATAVMDGVLIASNSAALGTAAGPVFVADGATLALANNITIAAKPLKLSGAGVSGAGALRNDSGLNAYNGPISVSGPVTIRAGSGRLSLGGAWDTAANIGAITLDSAGTALLLVTGDIQGGGSLIKVGPGTASLYGTNNYTGLTIVSEGTLSLGSSGSFRRSTGFLISTGAMLNVSAAVGGWTLLNGQYLQGEGTVAGSITANGTIFPGNGIGTLTVNGDLTLAGVSVIELGKNGTLLTNDLLVCTGTLAPGGVLTVNHNGPDALGLGDSFRFFSAGSFAPGAFSIINLPALPAQLAWDTSRLTVDGTLRVEPSAPPSLSASYNGAILSLAWPSEYSGYVLEGQTNGLDSSWLPVPGVVSNLVTLPIDPANGSAFYRLAKP